jgi:7-cyano-7-deazaguanine synthase
MEARPGQPAVVLLSGGLDSATTLAIAVDQGFQAHALSVDYGQRHRAELAAAARLAVALGAASHRVVRVDLRAIGGSALTADLPVPVNRDAPSMAAEIPITYVPARNTVLLALALGLAETLAAFDLFIGVNAVDYSGYPDCRPEFIAAFERLANLATQAGVESRGVFRIHAPLLHWSKEAIIRAGLRLGVDYGLTVSCYQADETGRACGQCDACLLRRAGFAAAGVTDPTRYVI